MEFADTNTLCKHMLEKDATYSKLRSERILQRHPTLVESYRTILFEWLSEVSQECKFHRETYHLALDLIDRYLAAHSGVKKNQLQLIGTTCLFLAAKYEEIRPPTANEFAETTAGACTADEIIDNEVVILSAINWDITPLTPNSWLNFYMHRMIDSEKDSFIEPTNNPILKYKHKRIASVLDLALLHTGTLRFSNSRLTAAAIYHYTSDQVVRDCSGYRYQDLADCIQWLVPFVETINEHVEELTYIVSCKAEGANTTQMHTHIASAEMLEIVNLKLNAIRSSLFKRKAYLIEQEEEDEEEQEEADSGIGHQNQVIVLTDVANGPREAGGTHSPLKPSPTVLLTPPSSTSKARRKRLHRDETIAGAAVSRAASGYFRHVR